MTTGWIAWLRTYGAWVLIALTTIASVATIWWLASVEVARIEGAEQAAWNQEAIAKARLLRENISARLGQTDTLHTLARLVSAARRRADTAAERDARAELQMRYDTTANIVDHVSAIATDGYLLWSTGTNPGTPVYFGDRPYIKAILGGGQRQFISEPLIDGLTGLRRIQFARADTDPDGRLRGVTIVSLNANAFLALTRADEIKGGDAIAVLRTDGAVLSGSLATNVARLPAADAHMRRFLESPKGMLEVPGIFDGILRIAAWERLDDEGLIVVAALDKEARQEALRRQPRQVRDIAILLMVSVGLAGTGLILALRWRKRVSLANGRNAALRESEARFRHLTEGLPEIIQLMNRDGDVVYTSPASLEIMGLPPDALAGRAFEAMVHPDDRDKLMARQLARHPTAERATARFRAIRPDGRTVWLQKAMGRLRHNASGDDVTVVASSRDVTEQVEAEHALQSAKLELDALLEATNGVLFRSVMGPNGPRLSFVSNSVETVTGFTVAEALRPGWFSNNADPAHHEARPVGTMKGHTATTFRFRHKNGNWLWLVNSSRRFFGPDGDEVIVGFARDITREHAADMRVAQAAKLALLGEMATSIAHELNQPLATISMAAENALAGIETSGQPNPWVEERLRRILQQTTRAAAVIDRMQMFGRRHDGDPGFIDVAAAVTGAEAVAAARLSRDHVTVEWNPDGKVPPAFGNTVMLEQVLVNLFVNAIDSIASLQSPLDRAHRVIRVSARRIDDTVAIRVADQAGGIPESILPRIFEPFFTTKPIGKGTGLGLSISYGIVRDMGGSIEVYNQDGGAVFEIRLQVADTAAGAVAA